MRFLTFSSILYYRTEFLSLDFSLQSKSRDKLSRFPRTFESVGRNLSNLLYALTRTERKFEKATILGRNCSLRGIVFRVSTNRQEPPNHDFLMEIREVKLFSTTCC